MPAIGAPPSTQNLGAMPPPNALWRRCVALALLARASSDSPLRRFDYAPARGADPARFTSDNGAGDAFVVVFAPAGVILKGFDHESAMSPYRLSPDGSKIWPGMYAGLPEALAPLARGESVSAGSPPTDVTFCLAYAYHRPGWACGVQRFHAEGDGSVIWLRFLNDSAKAYVNWSNNYYERAIPIALVETLFAHRPLSTPDVAKALPEADAEALVRLAASWGYGGPAPGPEAGAPLPGVRRVRHPKFGDGHLVREFEGKVEIAFASGLRVLARGFVTFLD